MLNTISYQLFQDSIERNNKHIRKQQTPEIQKLTHKKRTLSNFRETPKLLTRIFTLY